MLYKIQNLKGSLLVESVCSPIYVRVICTDGHYPDKSPVQQQENARKSKMFIFDLKFFHMYFSIYKWMKPQLFQLYFNLNTAFNIGGWLYTSFVKGHLKKKKKSMLNKHTRQNSQFTLRTYLVPFSSVTYFNSYVWGMYPAVTPQSNFLSKNWSFIILKYFRCCI